MFDKVDVPTGSDWSLSSIFWLGGADSAGFAKIEDAYYSWDGLPTFNRMMSSWTFKEIRFGWNKTDSSVRYFMLATPVNISMTDLSILTRNLPPTPPEEAIHRIPDSSMKSPRRGPFQPPAPGWPGTPIVYKAAEGKAIAGSCCGGRERAAPTEEGPKDLPSFGTESFTDYGNAGSITPNVIISIVFGFITVIFMMIGAAIALQLIHRDYDYGLRSASNTVGEVVGRWIAKLAAPIQKARAMISAVRSPGGVMASLKESGMEKLGDKLGDKMGGLETKSLDVANFKASLGSSVAPPKMQNLRGSSPGSLLKGLKR
jgi:hypothetical protein